MSDKGVLTISTYLYDVLNDSSLTGEITGDIYKEAEGLNDDLENVIIKTNGLNSSRETNVQPGLSNVNIEIAANANGTPKFSRFVTISDIIRTLLENNRHPGKGFYFDIIGDTLFPEMLQNKTYFYNFRLDIKKQ